MVQTDIDHPLSSRGRRHGAVNQQPPLPRRGQRARSFGHLGLPDREEIFRTDHQLDREADSDRENQDRAAAELLARIFWPARAPELRAV